MRCCKVLITQSLLHFASCPDLISELRNCFHTVSLALLQTRWMRCLAEGVITSTRP